MYLIITYDNVLSAPLAIPQWDPTRGHSPQLGSLREARRFDTAREAMDVLLSTQRLMNGHPLWPNVPEFAVVTESEAEMLTNVSQRMCDLAMRRI